MPVTANEKAALVNLAQATQAAATAPLQALSGRAVRPTTPPPPPPGGTPPPPAGGPGGTVTTVQRVKGGETPGDGPTQDFANIRLQTRWPRGRKAGAWRDANVVA